MLKCAIVLLIAIVLLMGHLYGAVAILVISSSMFKEVLYLKRKDEITRNIMFSWIDWYSYLVIFYYLLPKLFLRRNLIESLVWFDAASDNIYNQFYIHSILFHYHSQIS